MSGDSRTGRRVSTRAWVEQIMGMPVSVHVRAENPERPDIAVAVAAVFDDVRHADAVFSTWRADSDTMRWRAGELAIADAHPWLAEVVAQCVTAERVTDGLFTTDLVNHEGRRGWDPTGLVKGWAVENAAVHLRSLDAAAFSINAGGDIVCGLGRHSDGLAAPWRIGIQDPADTSAIATVIQMVDGAVATSGTTARGEHIIDPSTRRPVRRAGSTTVTGPSLLWADVWATATFVDPVILENRPEWSDYRVLVIGEGCRQEA